MLKDKYVYELKHDITGLLNTNKEQRGSIQSTFSRMPESMAHYIATALFKKSKINKSDIDKVVKSLKKYVLIKEIKTDNTFTIVLHFPKNKVSREQRILSAVAILNPLDTFNPETAFKIAVNRLIDTTNIGRIINTLLDRKNKRDSFKEVTECTIYIYYPVMKDYYRKYPIVTWANDSSSSYKIY